MEVCSHRAAAGGGRRGKASLRGLLAEIRDVRAPGRPPEGLLREAGMGVLAGRREGRVAAKGGQGVAWVR